MTPIPVTPAFPPPLVPPPDGDAHGLPRNACNHRCASSHSPLDSELPSALDFFHGDILCVFEDRLTIVSISANLKGAPTY
jgi:hypothetical protein